THRLDRRRPVRHDDVDLPQRLKGLDDLLPAPGVELDGAAVREGADDLGLRHTQVARQLHRHRSGVALQRLAHLPGHVSFMCSHRLPHSDRSTGASVPIIVGMPLATPPPLNIRLPLLITGITGVAGYNALHYFQKRYPGQVIGTRPRQTARLTGA